MAMQSFLGISLFVVSIQLIGAAVAGDDGRLSKVVRQVPAMYVFGDSTLDVGNNNYLPGNDVPRANMPLYGVDFRGSKPTGRFSNGYNLADSIARTLGLKQSPPAYLSLAPHSIRLVLTALSEGVSYASAGSGILDSTNAGKNIPLSKQVSHFASTKRKMEATVGARAVRRLLSGSFFLLGTGSNDVSVFAATQPAGDVAAFYSSLVSNYSAAITDLYEMGARKFAVINVGLVGCVPMARALSPTGSCIGGLNDLAAGFDAALGQLLAGLASGLPGLEYSLADYHGLSTETFANPQASGYVSVDSACCGSGRLGAESDCLPNSTLCGDHDGFVFWDRGHPSQRAGQLSAEAFYDGPAQFTAPVSFKQLANMDATY